MYGTAATASTAKAPSTTDRMRIDESLRQTRLAPADRRLLPGRA
jgi:hypothetical protein